MESNIDVGFEDKDREKERKDKIKSNIKIIKNEISKQSKKIKEFDEEIYNEIEEQCTCIDKATHKKELIEIKKKILNNLQKEKI